MIEELLLFLIVNTILLTVQLTVSKLLLLFLLALLTLKVYKWLRQEQRNDKIVIPPLPEPLDSLIVVELAAQLASLYLHSHSAGTYLVFIVGVGIFVAMASWLSLQTVIVAFFNLMIVLQLRRQFYSKVDQKIRARLGIRHTNSIYYNSTPPKRERQPAHLSPFRK